MRILNRYLLREFLLPLIYCLDAFALLWLVMDLFGRLDDFIEIHARFTQVIRYYLVIFPEAFVQIVPMSLLLGLLFCLANLGKHNEILAMRAGGVSLTRIATPLLSIGLAATVLVFVVNEIFVPGAHERANTLMQLYKGHAEPDIVENLFFTNHQAHRDWYVPRFNVHTRELQSPEVHERNPDGSARRDIFAGRAVWTGGQWIFQTVDVYDYTSPTSPPPVERFQQMAFPELNESPRRLLTENKRPTEMTSRELRRTIRTLERAGHSSQIPELRATLHQRYAFPATCLIVMWLGLPLGIQVRRSGALMSVGTALVLVVTYYIASEITLKLAVGQHLSAWLAAWLTNFTFFSVGAVLMWRAR